ncbi:MAG: HalOD1 output domain-containing protein [Haloferacaceae archaeon]
MPHLRLEDSKHDTIGGVVVEALAAARGEDALDLDSRLYDHLDPDALNRLYDHADATGAEWRFEFAADEFDVIVRSTGRVSVEERRATDPDPDCQPRC